MIQLTPQDEIRKQRDLLLSQSDWTQLPDSPLGSDAKSAWGAYREDLRNIPQNQDIESMNGIDDVTWPVVPS